MTGKQIIINGTDVSECECIIEDYYYQQANNLENGYTHIKNVCELGESGSECYNLFCKDNPNCSYKQLKRKEQECKELRKTVMYKCPQCSDEYLSPVGASLYEENNKLKQTLTEIKEIASKVLLNTHDLEQFKDADALFGALLEIHKKISECKGEYNEEIGKTIRTLL